MRWLALLLVAACGGSQAQPQAPACSCPGAIEQVAQPSGGILCRCARCFCADAALQSQLNSTQQCSAATTLWHASCE